MRTVTDRYQGVKNVCFFGKFCVLTKWMISSKKKFILIVHHKHFALKDSVKIHASLIFECCKSWCSFQEKWIHNHNIKLFTLIRMYINVNSLWCIWAWRVCERLDYLWSGVPVFFHIKTVASYDVTFKVLVKYSVSWGRYGS